MFIEQVSLSRRTVLRGMGVALALPWLDAMFPALAAAQSATRRTKRFSVFYFANGIMLDQFVPATVGSEFALPPILSPLADFQKQLTIISGLANAAGDPKPEGSGPHSRVSGCWLSGMRARRTENSDFLAGTTIDQFAARELGQETPLRSLELALEPNFAVGNCEGGYSCVYLNTFSWRTPTQPLPMETNPRVVFERMFGESGAGFQQSRLRTDRSILDSVVADLRRLQQAVGAGDRRTVDEYVQAVRDTERRIQQSEQRAGELSVELPEAPLGIPTDFEDHANLMMDLMLLAYRADITRVITFQIARELSARAYPELGVPEGHHDISHHGYVPEKMAKKGRIDLYHMQLLTRLVRNMATTADGDGTLLDNSILLVGAGMGDSHAHSPHNLPIALIGGGSGQLKGGRHIKAPLDTPFMNLGLTLLDKFGVELEGLGDSTGRLADV